MTRKLHSTHRFRRLWLFIAADWKVWLSCWLRPYLSSCFNYSNLFALPYLELVDSTDVSSLKPRKYRSLLRINCRGKNGGPEENKVYCFAWIFCDQPTSSCHCKIWMSKIFIFIFAIYWVALLNYKHDYYTPNYLYINANMPYLHVKKRASIENHFNLSDQFQRSKPESLCCFRTRIYSCIFCVYFIAEYDSAVFQSVEIANIFTKLISPFFDLWITVFRKIE